LRTFAQSFVDAQLEVFELPPPAVESYASCNFSLSLTSDLCVPQSSRPLLVQVLCCARQPIIEVVEHVELRSLDMIGR